MRNPHCRCYDDGEVLDMRDCPLHADDNDINRWDAEGSWF